MGRLSYAQDTVLKAWGAHNVPRLEEKHLPGLHNQKRHGVKQKNEAVPELPPPTPSYEVDIKPKKHTVRGFPVASPVSNQRELDTTSLTSYLAGLEDLALNRGPHAVEWDKAVEDLKDLVKKETFKVDESGQSVYSAYAANKMLVGVDDYIANLLRRAKENAQPAESDLAENSPSDEIFGSSVPRPVEHGVVQPAELCEFVAKELRLRPADITFLSTQYTKETSKPALDAHLRGGMRSDFFFYIQDRIPTLGLRFANANVKAKERKGATGSTAQVDLPSHPVITDFDTQKEELAEWRRNFLQVAREKGVSEDYAVREMMRRYNKATQDYDNAQQQED